MHGWFGNGERFGAREESPAVLGLKRAPSRVTLDGSFGEGGGALIRTALAMSALTQQGVAISQARGGTRYPGLDVEDLALIEALKEVTDAATSGPEAGAEGFTFDPRRTPKGMDGVVGLAVPDQKRYANALVLLNTLQSVLVHSGVFSRVVAEGETFGSNTLTYDSFVESTLEALKRMGFYSHPTLKEAAFGRESRGSVELEIEPSYLEGVDWRERGDLEEVTAYVSYSHLTEAIPQRAASHLITLSRQAKLPMNIELQKVAAASPGIHVTVCARYERGYGSGSAMGTRGVRVEAVATSAFEQLFSFVQSKASVDAHLADQLLLACVFAHDPVTLSVSNLSRSLITSIWVIKQFMPIRISVTGEEGGPGVLTVKHG